MIRQLNRLNEEVARWAFEIKFNDSKLWRIAFTNPTAGPWKTIKAMDNSGHEGEVYRFPLEENRPDIIMYNDQLNTVLIIEAKDSLEKLLLNDQPTKSVKVVDDLAKMLIQKKDNPFWKNRTNYKVILGLLWGCENDSYDAASVKTLCNTYLSKIESNTKDIDGNLIICVESLFKRNIVTCNIFSYLSNKQYTVYAERLVKSLKN